MPDTTQETVYVPPTNDTEIPQTPEPAEPRYKGSLKPKRTKTTKAIVRTIDELHDASVKSMSDTEKAKYIDALRDLTAYQHCKIEELQKSCESAFAQNRAKDQQFSEFKMRATAKYRHVQQAIQTLHVGVGLLGTLED